MAVDLKTDIYKEQADINTLVYYKSFLFWRQIDEFGETAFKCLQNFEDFLSNISYYQPQLVPIELPFAGFLSIELFFWVRSFRKFSNTENSLKFWE